MKKINISKLFIIVSFAFIQFLVIFYGYRLIYYYNMEHKPAPVSTEDYTLISKLKKEEVSKSEAGLQKKDDIYYYNGKVTNNYIRYEGYLWRVVSFDDATITIISEEPLTYLSWGNTNYENSYIKKWIEETFKEKLKNKDNYLMGTSTLTKDQYESAGGKDSFLNNTYPFWIISSDICYINSDGQVSINEETQNMYGIRPVLKIKSEILSESGIGTQTDPYETIKNTGSILSERYIGEYVSWNNIIFRILDTDNQNVKIVTNEPLDTKQSFGQNNTFNPDKTKTLAHYLNNEFYNSLHDKEYIVKSTWNVGSYGGNDNYNPDNVKTKTIESYIGLPAIGETFTTQSTILITPKDETTKDIYTVGNSVFSINATSAGYFRPTLYLKGDIPILSGNGTLQNPLKVGE